MTASPEREMIRMYCRPLGSDITEDYIQHLKQAYLLTKTIAHLVSNLLDKKPACSSQSFTQWLFPQHEETAAPKMSMQCAVGIAYKIDINDEVRQSPQSSPSLQSGTDSPSPISCSPFWTFWSVLKHSK
ncbi:hypothetical protein CCH79_00012201 [Gambusia affinis]|uniref:Uncharacterized protein n=1 Tax=Gambusia affinis TaxID=33528 RepID=A0A315USD8_GAMAF|nr:hypothetical protein CCH79_00012201 [Gambusia affinis]